MIQHNKKPYVFLTSVSLQADRYLPESTHYRSCSRPTGDRSQITHESLALTLKGLSTRYSNFRGPGAEDLPTSFHLAFKIQMSSKWLLNQLIKELRGKAGSTQSQSQSDGSFPAISWIECAVVRRSILAGSRSSRGQGSNLRSSDHESDEFSNYSTPLLFPMNQCETGSWLNAVAHLKAEELFCILYYYSINNLTKILYYIR